MHWRSALLSDNAMAFVGATKTTNGINVQPMLRAAISQRGHVQQTDRQGADAARVAVAPVMKSIACGRLCLAGHYLLRQDATFEPGRSS
ncbi:hypothetical protein [Ferrovibrio terrae]|uniref:hypothetical protein n=1 Tax=Ferrovibrio terrae TaxID=2594003 RepID=UPI003138274A